MAKRRPRGQVREVSRAELKAHERRAASVSITEAPVRTSANVEQYVELEPSDEGAPRSGVLPPRVNRAVPRAPALTREQELAYIRGDLRRLVLLTTGIVVLLFVLALILPLLGL